MFGLETSNKSQTGDLFESDLLDLDSAIIRAEKHGIPQARHRIIILGIREELAPAISNDLKLDVTDPIAIEVAGAERLEGKDIVVGNVPSSAKGIEARGGGPGLVDRPC